MTAPELRHPRGWSANPFNASGARRHSCLDYGPYSGIRLTVDDKIYALFLFNEMWIIWQIAFMLKIIIDTKVFMRDVG
jgi:hypothetical protein